MPCTVDRDTFFNEQINWALAIDASCSVTEAAKLLGCSRQNVLQRLETNSITGIKVGTTWVVYKPGILQEIEKNGKQETVKKRIIFLVRLLTSLELKIGEVEQDNLILQQENENLKQTVRRLAKEQK